MNLLADTNTLIWFAQNDRQLSADALEALMSSDHRVFISVVSRWEIELKQGRHPAFLLPEPIEPLMTRAGFEPLDLTFAVPALLPTLPWIHKYPYDRILVAQALHHDLTLVTSDEAISRYPVRTLW